VCAPDLGPKEAPKPPDSEGIVLTQLHDIETIYLERIGVD